MDEQSWKKLLSVKADRVTENNFEFSSNDQAFEEYKKVVLSGSYSDLKRPTVFAHLAQTLDGRIACVGGDSKWIGNKGNLIHAHRMRALCDCVMVGKHTWVKDKPQLNVRHVEGKDPVKVLVDGCSINQNDYPKTYSINDGEESGSWDSPQDLLLKIFQRGIKTIFLEGGGKTISFFLKHRLIDYLQLHISPIVLGSGIDSITLPVVESLDQATYFKDFSFIPIDDHIMFSGKVAYK